MVEPVKLNCGHWLCAGCLKKLSKLQSNEINENLMAGKIHSPKKSVKSVCPECKATCELELSKYKIDWRLQELLYMAYPGEFN